MLVTIVVRVHVTIGGALWFRLTDRSDWVSHGAVRGSASLKSKSPESEGQKNGMCSTRAAAVFPFTVLSQESTEVSSQSASE
jgi:hypothetical protein